MVYPMFDEFWETESGEDLVKMSKCQRQPACRVIASLASSMTDKKASLPVEADVSRRNNFQLEMKARWSAPSTNWVWI